jgi:carbonic anhydrase
MKKIIIGDVKLPEQKWILDNLNGECLWFYVDQAVIANPYGCTIRNIVSALMNQSIEELLVLGSCENDQQITLKKLDEYFKREQIGADSKNTVEYIFSCAHGSTLSEWLNGLPTKEDNIKKSVNILKQHPMIPKRLNISGYLVNEPEKHMMQIV